MTMTDPRYKFLSWFRRGFAAQSKATPGAQTTLEFKVGGIDSKLAVQAWGPGDVTAIEPRAFVRSEPRPGTVSFEPNFLAAVELDPPELPWLLSPGATPDATTKLTPWIALVVLTKSAGVSLTSDPSASCQILEISTPEAFAELPDLADASSWAHAQIATSDDSNANLGAVLAAHGHESCARLIAARRLSPRTAYLACVVPTYHSGACAGLGPKLGGAVVEDFSAAWTQGLAPASWPFRLPAYHAWEFTTGDAGDFASLASRLVARPLPTSVGWRPLDVSLPGFGLHAPPQPELLRVEGALRVPHAASLVPAWTGTKELRDRLDAATRQEARMLEAPFYARAQAGVDHVPGAGWVSHLNLDPGWRAAAGVGARVVRDNAEALIAAAWNQLGNARAVNQALRNAQLARETSIAIHTAHLKTMAPIRQLQVTRAAHTRITVEPGATAAQAVDRSALPDAALSTAFRRMARPGGPIAKRAASTSEPLAARVTSRLAMNIQMPGALRTTPFVTEIVGGVATVRRVPPGGMLGLEDLGDKRVTFANATEKSIQESAGWPDPVAAPGTGGGPAVVGRPTSGGPPTGGGASTSGGGHVVPTMRAARATATSTLSRQRDGEKDPGPLVDENDPDPKATLTAMRARFKSAASKHQKYLLEHELNYVRPEPAPPALPPMVAPAVAAGLHPASAIESRIAARIDRSALVSTTGDPLDPVVVVPDLPDPMFESLRDVSQHLLVPNLDAVPPETLALLETNTAFVEAYMAGLNHEMGRELLWREYPLDARGTIFRGFWTEGDVPPIATWNTGNSLGATLGAAGDRSVFLVRGELLRRYPNAAVFLIRGAFFEGETTLGSEEKAPIFAGTLDPDVSFFGFDVGVESAKGRAPTGDTGSPVPSGGTGHGDHPPPDDPGDPGWFLVIQQHPNEPRFRLDSKTSGLLLSGDVPPTVDVPKPASSAAAIAKATLEHPIRLAVHARRFFP